MSKAKFKVGDKVRILDGSKIHDYTGGYGRDMIAHEGEITTVLAVREWDDGRTAYNLKGSVFNWDERGLELVTERPTWKVAIIPDGDKTIGRLYDGHNLVKEVSTIKSPHDEYSVEEAIKVICERLTEKPEKKEEPPKLYNGKVVCVDTRGWDKYYKVGKIYNIVDGAIRDDNGDIMFRSGYRCRDFDEYVAHSSAKWIEVVE